MGIVNFMTFLMATLVFVITPGIDTLFVLNKSMSLGRKSGFYGALGISSGVLMHTVMAALGLSVLLTKSAFAFAIIKYLGAIYLIYLGVLKLRTKKGLRIDNVQTVKESTPKSDFKSGLMTNLLNPKVALFFLAFFPQFVEPSQSDNPIPFLVLGLTYAVLGTIWSLCLILFSVVFSKKLNNYPKLNTGFGRFSGFVFVGMGIKIALTK